jgi:hypothetical protein
VALYGTKGTPRFTLLLLLLRVAMALLLPPLPAVAAL